MQPASDCLVWQICCNGTQQTFRLSVAFASYPSWIITLYMCTCVCERAHLLLKNTIFLYLINFLQCLLFSLCFLFRFNYFIYFSSLYFHCTSLHLSKFLCATTQISRAHRLPRATCGSSGSSPYVCCAAKDSF